MIGYLQGKVLKHTKGKILVGLGSSKDGCIGYLVSVPSRAEYQGFQPEEKIELYTHSFVREDHVGLFGFLKEFEKDLFLSLLTVNKIGPKNALSLLSVLEPQVMIHAILQRQVSKLTQATGVGKKAAERIILELRDRVQDSKDPVVESSTSSLKKHTGINEAESALIYLGYKELEAKQRISLVLRHFKGKEVPSSEELVRLVLQKTQS